MKKILYGILAVFLVILVALYIVLFTSFGNKFVAGIIEDKIRTATALDVNVSKFELGLTKLNTELDIANMAKFTVDGNLSLFSLGFDLNYLLSLNKDYLAKNNIKTKENLNFGGAVFGSAFDFNASGRGQLFGSNVELDAHILSFAPALVNLNANGIKIEELLDLLSKPRYAQGVININADIFTKENKLAGNTLINLYTKSLDYKSIEKDFNLSLPANSEPNADIKANINGDLVAVNTVINNSYAEFLAKNTQFNLGTQILTSDFTANLKNLSPLTSLNLSTKSILKYLIYLILLKRLD